MPFLFTIMQKGISARATTRIDQQILVNCICVLYGILLQLRLNPCVYPPCTILYQIINTV